ncbi:phosphorylated adapter RNA export protein [Chironomus tepperi]|uniref:phosphorylated adapter RNA export protein n=1 Tax=Chironomus tepperi TaxID=113505 RepID=UPI00391FC8CF
MNKSSDESESETEILPKRIETKYIYVLRKKINKNGALWKEMLEEESLMEEMKTCEVAKNIRKRKIDRGTESYDYNEFDNRSNSPENSSAHCSERKKIKVKHSQDRQSKNLPQLTETDATDEDLAADIAFKLNEENIELIKRAVSAIGQEECVKFYKKTQKIERNGGLLTVNKQRRRTSGGIFLFLIKTSNEITNVQKKKIFEKDT